MEKKSRSSRAKGQRGGFQWRWPRSLRDPESRWIRRWLKKWNQTPQILRVSFSAVWTATIATKYSFCSFFRDLQDLQTFAPLRSQNFRKKRVQHFARMKWNFISFSQKSMNNYFAIFLPNFNWFLSEFHEWLQKIAKILQILRKVAGKIRKNARNFWKLCRFHSFISFRQVAP